MLEEIKKFKDLIVNWLMIFIIGGIFFFFFSFTTTEIFGYQIYTPSISGDSLAVIFFKMMQEDLLPSSVILVATGPLSALNTQTVVAFLMSFLLTFPYLLYKLVKYISPAMYKKEKTMLLAVLLPVILLFVGGSIFSYKYVIPQTFKALYSYTSNIGVMAIFSMDDFVATVVTFLVVSGVLFLMPIFMAILSLLGIVSYSFWWDKWRYSQLIFLVFSAIITPDGSGVSMILLSLPLIGLYTVGAGVAQFLTKRKHFN